MKGVITVIFLCLFFTGGSTFTFSHPNIDVYYNEPPVRIDEDNSTPGDTRDLLSSLIDLVNGAQVTVYCALQEIDFEEIEDEELDLVEALVRAKRDREVDVRVVTEADYYERRFDDRPDYLVLEAEQIVVIPDVGGALMHNKFIVVDGRYVWMGSTNTTGNGFLDNPNNSLIIDSPEIAAFYTLEFNQMFGGDFHGSKEDLDVGRFDLDGVGEEEVKVMFSPKGHHTIAEIRAEIMAARSSIYFCIFAFTEDEISGDIIGARDGGVDVRGVFDEIRTGGGRYCQYYVLCDEGFDVKLDNYPGKLHHKFMVIDAGTGFESRVITGSYNWSGNAESNDENTVIIRDREISDLYYNIFADIYTNSALDDCEGARELAPRYFISGSVVDENDAGMEGVTVEITGDQDWQGWQVTTNQNGEYRFATLLGENYAVTVEEQEGNAFTISIDHSPQGENYYDYTPLERDEEEQNFYLVVDQPATFSISGTVFDAVGENGLSDIRVILSKDGDGETWTDADGRYEFANLEPGYYGVMPHQDEYRFSTTEDGSGPYYRMVTVINSDIGDQDFYSVDTSLPDLRIANVRYYPYHGRWRARVKIENLNHAVTPLPEDSPWIHLAWEPMMDDGNGGWVSPRPDYKNNWNSTSAVYGSALRDLIDRGYIYKYVAFGLFNGVDAHLFRIDIGSGDERDLDTPGRIEETNESNNHLYAPMPE